MIGTADNEVNTTNIDYYQYKNHYYKHIYFLFFSYFKFRRSLYNNHFVKNMFYKLGCIVRINFIKQY